MLSYRHSFHAGNFADVLKHIIQIEILEYLCKKDKAFDYIDTHAGAGLYDLTSKFAEKKQEYKNGIAKLKLEDWPELASYLSLVKAQNPTDELVYYPGSAKIAEHYLREHDRAWLFELHSTDFVQLDELFANNKRVRVQKLDGFKGLLGVIPPASKRGMILIDPAYEVKTDYEQVLEAILKAYAKFPSGIYALWYPVVERSRVHAIEQEMITSGIKKIELFELSVKPDSKKWGMTGAGMILINPPWTLYDKMCKLLPKLAKTLAYDGKGHFRCERLVGE